MCLAHERLKIHDSRPDLPFLKGMRQNHPSFFKTGFARKRVCYNIFKKSNNALGRKLRKGIHDGNVFGRNIGKIMTLYICSAYKSERLDFFAECKNCIHAKPHELKNDCKVLCIGKKRTHNCIKITKKIKEALILSNV